MPSDFLCICCRSFVTLFCINLSFFSNAQVRSPVESFDVVIVSGSSGGIGAAIGAARLGASVALIEDSPVLGGMLSNGISNIDAFSYESLSGVFEEFRQQVKRHYAPVMKTDPVYARQMSDRLKERNFVANHIDKRSFQINQPVQGGTWEPKVADMLFKKMAAAYPHLKIYYNRYPTPDKGEGDFFLKNAMTAFQVPYGAIVPKNVDELLVPVALSATHVAFSAIRMDPTWTVIGQAAGIAAVLSIRNNVPVRNVNIAQVQTELLKQKCKLVFYWDVAADHPHFEAIQLMSLKHSLTGDANRDFHPDSLLTRADASIILSKAFQLLPSISNAHFKDVPFSHMAFREIETLFDNGALTPLGIEPKWTAENGYDARRHSGFKQDYGLWNFYPDTMVSKIEFQQMIQKIKIGGAFTKEHYLNVVNNEVLPFIGNTVTRSSALA